MAGNCLHLEKRQPGGDCINRAKHLTIIFHGNRADPAFQVYLIYRDTNGIMIGFHTLCQL